MRRKSFWIAASCILTLAGLLPAFSSGASEASKEKVLYSFSGGSDGGQPLSDLTIDSAGNLYGTTSQGGTGTACGSGGCGTVFELKRSQDGWKEQVLYSFAGGKDGAFPAAGLTFDTSGNLYGTTASGGTGYGTVFKLAPNSQGGWTERVIYSFDYGNGGAAPAADLVLDAHGNLYGTASQGGSGGNSCNASGCGTVFELTPQPDGSWAETTIHIFEQNSSDGIVPSSGVILDSAGNVFGMTLYGGAGRCSGGVYGIDGCGSVYELTPNSGGWTETILYNFVQGCGFGIHPSGGLFFDKAGHLRGTSQAGGDGFGTVVQLYDSQKNSRQQSGLHLFYGNPDGMNPVGRLAVDATGKLFGVTSSGGANRTGIIFELRPSKDAWKETILHSFGGTGDGATPQAGLVLDSKGRLYGTTQYGGSGTACNQGCGTVFEVIP